MSLSLVLAIWAVVATESEAVVEVYRQACLDGSLRLNPARGELIDGVGLPTVIQRTEIWTRPSEVTYVRMKWPPRTFVMIERYGPEARTDFEIICKVASRRLTEQDAERALKEGAINPKVKTARNDARLFEPYEIDQPKTGFRKRLYVDGDWMMLETATYKSAK